MIGTRRRRSWGGSATTSATGSPYVRRSGATSGPGATTGRRETRDEDDGCDGRASRWGYGQRARPNEGGAHRGGDPRPRRLGGDEGACPRDAGPDDRLPARHPRRSGVAPHAGRRPKNRFRDPVPPVGRGSQGCIRGLSRPRAAVPDGPGPPPVVGLGWRDRIAPGDDGGDAGSGHECRSRQLQRRGRPGRSPAPRVDEIGHGLPRDRERHRHERGVGREHRGARRCAGSGGRGGRHQRRCGGCPGPPGPLRIHRGPLLGLQGREAPRARSGGGAPRAGGRVLPDSVVRPSRNDRQGPGGRNAAVRSDRNGGNHQHGRRRRPPRGGRRRGGARTLVPRRRGLRGHGGPFWRNAEAGGRDGARRFPGVSTSTNGSM